MTKYNFFIPGRLPGMNEIIDAARAVKGFSAFQKKRYTNRVADVIFLTFRNYKPIKKAWISCSWVEKDRRRDPDNICAAKKYILDGMVKANLLEGDGWKHIAGFTDTWAVGKEPGVWVSMEEV